MPRLNVTEDVSNAGRRWLEAIAIPLAVGCIAVLGTLAGTSLANHAATENQRAIFTEQKAQNERDKRGDAYIGFLDVSSRLARTLTAAHQCRTDQRSPSTNCDSATTALKVALEELGKSVNIVLVYGSSSASTLMDPILKLLPPLYTISEADIEGAIAAGLDGQEFNRYLTEFQRNMCMELPANPRHDC